MSKPLKIRFVSCGCEAELFKQDAWKEIKGCIWYRYTKAPERIVDGELYTKVGQEVPMTESQIDRLISFKLIEVIN